MTYNRPQEIVSIPVADLKAYERNPRINEQAVPALMESIKRIGFRNPIYVTPDLTIIAGHTRLKAARALGMTEVDCIIVSDLTEAEMREMRLSDNRLNELAKWDLGLLHEEVEWLENEGADLDYMEMDEYMETDEMEILPGDIIEDDPESIIIPKVAVTRRGDVLQLGRHRLMCGDSTSIEDVMTLTGGQEMDLLVTDPPYNVDYEGGTKDHLKIENDKMEDEQFYRFLLRAFQSANHVMKDGAPAYVWYTEKETENFIRAFKKCFTHHETLIWNKNAIVLGHLDYHKKHEPCLYGWKHGKHYFTDDRTQSSVYEDKGLEPRKMKKDELVELIERMLSDKVSTTVLNERRPTLNKDHPTMKPISLLARLVRNSSRISENVLDLFGGSGSTLITCEQLGRKCYIMELDPIYCDVIIKRYETFTGQKATRVVNASEEVA